MSYVSSSKNLHQGTKERCKNLSEQLAPQLGFELVIPKYKFQSILLSWTCYWNKIKYIWQVVMKYLIIHSSVSLNTVVWVVGNPASYVGGGPRFYFQLWKPAILADFSVIFLNPSRQSNRPKPLPSYPLTLYEDVSKSFRTELIRK